ncbi:hypothetical protein ACRAWD_22570 [Caulobacter segnis]
MAAFDSAYRVGSVVVRELAGHWDRYENTAPKMTSIGEMAK